MNDIETQLFANVKEFVGFACKRLGEPELAADAVQESLLKAVTRSIKFGTRRMPRHGSTGFFGERSSIFTAAGMRASEP